MGRGRGRGAVISEEGGESDDVGRGGRGPVREGATPGSILVPQSVWNGNGAREARRAGQGGV